MTASIPVIGLTGYLGAGKTTLLNHLLRAPGARIGVVVNDFGDINVDAGLVTGHVDARTAITGGCVCCLPDAGGLDVTLAGLVDPRLALDAIIIEASGVADPISLQRVIRGGSVGGVRSGGMVDVIDAAQYFSTVDTAALVPARFAAATLVVINKADLLPVDEREATIVRIRQRVLSRNPNAEIVVATRARIDPALVYDARVEQDPPDQLPIAELIRLAVDDSDHDEDHGHGHEHAPDGRHEHIDADAVTVRAAHPIDAGQLMQLILDPPASVYRLKGTITVARSRGGVSRVLVNVVGGQVHLETVGVAGARQVSGDLDDGLVAIGIGLDTARVRQAIEDALMPANHVSDARGVRLLERYLRLSA